MKLLYIIFTCFLLVDLSAQSVWTASDIPVSAMRNNDAMYMPNRYFSVKLDDKVAKNELKKAVEAPFSSGKHILFDLPMPDGSIERFMTYESPVMEAGLAAKYPSIKTYKGLSEDGKSITRFGYGPNGFHASIRTPKGEVYVDQVSRSGGQYYVSYFVADHGEPRDAAITFCGTDHSKPATELREPVGIANRNMGVDLHVYRFALACTGVWGADRGTKEAALADMVTSVNRLNQIYENEAAFRLVLIDNNDRLIQLDPNNDGYSNQDQGRSLLQQNTSRINTLLSGNGGYDLGHIYTKRCTDVGGVAALGSMCQNNKGAGVTCHYTNLLYITVQVAAHEIGHQLSARHTFNNCSDGSGDNGNASLGNDYEPGSGSTIMSYGGLCGSNNVQGNNEDYYNNASLVEIYRHTREAGAFDCAQKIETDNIAPTVNIPLEDDFYIPKSTYFVLEGEGEDANGDNLTYNWEQHDAGNNTCVYGDPFGSCPIFRSFEAKEVPYRFFPREQRIISGSGDISEILPTYSRDLTFALTVRDNNPDAGFAVWDYVEFKVDDTAGPFKVLTPGLAEEFEVGQNVNVTWDVANTDNALVNCQSVKIYLSIEKALHESDPNLILLAEGVANNGEANVILPNIAPTTQARILIKAQNNIFFDISDFNFKIVEASSPRPFFSMDKSRDNLCLPGSSTLNIETSGLAGYDGNLKFEAYDLPVGITADFSEAEVKAGETVSVNFDLDNTVETGTYQWNIRSISDNDDTLFRSYFVDVISTDFSDLVSIGPDEGLKDSPGLPIFNWSSSKNATDYNFQLASNPSFEAGSLIYNEMLKDTFFETPDFLDKSSVFYWRVKALNICGEGESTFVRSLGTVNLDCGEYSAFNLPINISGSGTPTVQSSVFVPSSGQVSDINVSNISLNHNFFKDLKAVLKSPQGTEVTIWDNSCAKNYNMNVAFDDDSPRFFDCSNGVSIFRPVGKLEDFNTENPEGDWVLEVSDKQGGNGGAITNFELEICGSIVTNAPYIVNNETVQIQPNNKPRIGGALLLTQDDDNTPNELVYTVVKSVEFGQLLKNGQPLSVGETFTQFDLNEGRVFYENTNDTNFDSFYFTVEDGNGGWISITQFRIEIDEDFPSSSVDVDLSNEVLIYPNPSANYFNINLSERAKKLNTLQVLDIHGRVLKQNLISEGLQRINTIDLQNGVYLINITDGTTSVVKKIVIQK